MAELTGSAQVPVHPPAPPPDTVETGCIGTLASVYAFHGWFDLADSTYEHDGEYVGEVAADIRAQIKRAAPASHRARFDIHALNGSQFLVMNGLLNRREQHEGSLVDRLVARITESLPGSYGILYEWDDELPGPNRYRVRVMTRGRVEWHADPFLSPLDPVIEDNDERVAFLRNLAAQGGLHVARGSFPVDSYLRDFGPDAPRLVRWDLAGCGSEGELLDSAQRVLGLPAPPANPSELADALHDASLADGGVIVLVSGTDTLARVDPALFVRVVDGLADVANRPRPANAKAHFAVLGTWPLETLVRRAARAHGRVREGESTKPVPALVFTY